MKPILTAQQMRDMERAYFDAGAASIDLMERAAAALCDELLHALAGRGKTCVFACGTGGNGGDGYAAARLFAEKGGRAIILPVGQPRTADAIRNCERARGAVFAFADVAGLYAIPRPDAWADCLFGIGLSRTPEGDAARVIERMNADREAGSVTISADIPSGLCADDGTVFSPCVRADVTVAFQTANPGHWLGGGMDAVFQNLNWWGRPDTWTEPCAIVDSLMLSGELYRVTGREMYRRCAARIFRNGLASSQREDGGAGTDTVVFRDQPGFADCDTLSLHGWEAPFCCSMRLAEGLWYAQVNRAMLYCEQELAEDGTPLVRQDQYGRYMCGDYVLAEPSLPEGAAGDWKLPAPLAVTDGHRLSPLVRFYEIPASVAAVLRQRVLF